MAIFVVAIIIAIMGYVMLYVPYKNQKPKCLKCHLPKKLNEYKLCENCTPTNEQLEKINQKLAFNFMEQYGENLQEYENVLVEAAENTTNIKNLSIQQQIKIHQKVISAWNKLKNFCYAHGNGDGIIYFTDKWEHCHNSKYSDFCFIDNYETKLEELEELYESDTSAEVVLQKLTVEELKNMLRENGLPLSGKKLDLINRILENISEDQILNES